MFVVYSENFGTDGAGVAVVHTYLSMKEGNVDALVPQDAPQRLRNVLWFEQAMALIHKVYFEQLNTTE